MIKIGFLINDPIDQGNLFCQYFASVFAIDNGNLTTATPRVLPICSRSEVSLNPASVLIKVLRILKSKTTHVPDGLPNILFKNLANVLCDPSAFNLILL